jgi:hypothetical protein
MAYYDPWSHALQLFFTRILQFILASLAFGLLAWGLLLRYLGGDFVSATRQAFTGDNAGLRLILVLCALIGASLSGWLFTYITMRWPSRNRRADRHHRGARVIDRDDE